MAFDLRWFLHPESAISTGRNGSGFCAFIRSLSPPCGPQPASDSGKSGFGPYDW